jgi:hypothetical protein
LRYKRQEEVQVGGHPEVLGRFGVTRTYDLRGNRVAELRPESITFVGVSEEALKPIARGSDIRLTTVFMLGDAS